MNFLIFRNSSGFFWNFLNFQWISKDFLELKIDFSEDLKCTRDVAWSEPSDCITIDGRGEEATWQHEKRLIKWRFKDRWSSLKIDGTRGLNWVHRMRLISTIDRESYNGWD